MVSFSPVPLARLLEGGVWLEAVEAQQQQHPARYPLDIEIPEDLRLLTQVFERGGGDLFLVGGAVRDALQGKEPKDWDVATSLPPDRVVALISGAGRGYRVIPVGEAFGVVRVLTPEGNEYEVATFRTEEGYTDGRRPDKVSFSGIENDVMRRDLTFNALFYDLGRGEVVDYVGGVEDLRNNVVRAVGNAEDRFQEDRLRVLRVLRFAARTGGTIDPETLSAIRRDPSLRKVSPERIRDEFLKGVESAQNLQGFLDLFTDLGLWSEVFPGMTVTPGSVSGSSPLVVLAQLLEGNPPDKVKKTLNSLRYLSSESGGVAFLVALGQQLSEDTAYRLWKLWKQTKVSPGEVESFLQGKVEEDLIKAFLTFKPQISAQELLDQGYDGKGLGKEIERQETLRWFKGGRRMEESVGVGGGALMGHLSPPNPKSRVAKT